ncbi:GntR family transcriptional regulator [Yinghuangia sp. YIM S10712]|uniref:GntR family transcriptional regulator n=1 Tax=Yinghuangia sp. YIM S10712 TaxID=3436930 RepID=UPI003F52E412
MPKWRDIADAIRADLDNGLWEAGERLPGRAELAERYGTSIDMIRAAQEHLIREGLLEGRPGSGTYVRGGSAQFIQLRALDGQSAIVLPDGMTREGESESTTATAHIAHRLEVAVGAPVMHTRHEYMIDKRPAMLLNSWEPLAITAGTSVVLPDLGPLAGRGVVERMAAIGITITRVSERLTKRIASSPETEALGLPAETHLLTIRRTHYDANNRPVETADILVPADRWEIGYELPVSHAD